MKSMNDLHRELQDQAGIFKLWGALIAIGIPIADAARILSSDKGPYGIYRGVFKGVSDKLAAGEKLSAALTDQPVLFSFVPALAGNGSWRAVSDDQRIMEISRIAKRVANLAQAGAEDQKINEILFYDLLGTLLTLSSPILHNLQIAGDCYLSPDETKALVDTVKEGDALTASMRAIPMKFARQDCNLIGIGEQVGAVPEICARIAETKERLLFASLPGPSIKIRTDSFFTLVDLENYEILACLVDAGLPMLRALKVTVAQSTEKDAHPFNQLAVAIETGLMPSEAMTQRGFPEFIIEMIKVGEIQGNIEQVLKAIADHLRWEILGIEPAAEVKPLEVL